MTNGIKNGKSDFSVLKNLDYKCSPENKQNHFFVQLTNFMCKCGQLLKNQNEICAFMGRSYDPKSHIKTDFSECKKVSLSAVFLENLNKYGYQIAIIPYEKKEDPGSKSISEIVKEAKEHGMTYGAYVSMLERQRR